MRSDMKHDIYRLLAEVKLLPLYTATDLTYLDTLERVLIQNEVTFIEVTFRSHLAIDAIKHLAKSGKLYVGAGTVRTLEEAKAAVENGAQFIVSPAVIPEVIEYCIMNKIPIFPGVATPGDIQKALAYGINVVKFFPADIYGGLPAIKALSGPYYDVKFLPTGGIDQENFIDYLANQSVIGVGGSFIISEDLVKENNGQKANENLSFLTKQIRKIENT